jgi:hypothetical protein
MLTELTGRSIGWGTWIRTKTNGVRVRCSTIKLFPKPSGRTNDADAKFASGECGSFCAAASLSYAQRRGGYGCTLTSKADLTQYANLFASCP